MRGWLDEAWSRAVLVQVIAGGEGFDPFADREVLADIRDAVSIARLRNLTTQGRLTGDSCRCPGGPTIILRDGSGQMTTSASIHGFGSVSWDRPRFHNDLDVDDAAGLHLFLARQGVPQQLAPFVAPLTEYLNLHEGQPQFRPAGTAGRHHLAARAVPDALHPLLSRFTGQQTGSFSVVQVDNVRQRLNATVTSPADRATALLSWLGRLPVPAEALWGEGVLVRRLLADISRADLATAVATTNSAHIAMA